MRIAAAALIFALAAAAAGLTGAAAARWVEAAARAGAAERLAAAAEDGWARVEVDGLRVLVTGAPPSGAARDRALAALSAAPFLSLVDRTAPPPRALIAAPPEALSLLKDAHGLTLTGRAHDDGFAAALAAALTARGGPALRDLCVTGAAPATPAARDVAEAAALLMEGLEHGELHIAPPRLRLSGVAAEGARGAALDETAARLRQAGWLVEIAAERPAPAAPAPALAATEAPRVDLAATTGGDAGGFAFTARLEGGRLSLAGPAGGGAMDALSAYAHAAFPGVTVEAAPAPGAGPAGWRLAAMTGLTALAHLDSGALTLNAGAAQLTGAAADPRRVGPAHATLTALDGWRVGTRITVTPARLAAAQPLTADACLARLAEIAGGPALAFAPGKAELSAAGVAAAGRLAQTLGRCAGGRFEVGGHTDSQGSAASNLRLSRARAEAVRDAILAAGVAPARVAAAGYGETRPVADNATEAGRRANRRIEIRLMETEE